MLRRRVPEPPNEFRRVTTWRLLSTCTESMVFGVSGPAGHPGPSRLGPMVTVYLSAKRSDCFDTNTYKDTGELLGLIPPAWPRIRPDFAELMKKPPHKVVRNYLEQSVKPEPPVSETNVHAEPQGRSVYLDRQMPSGVMFFRF